MSKFDAIKAQREIIAGLLDVHKVIVARARQAERQHVEAEAEYNSLIKLDRFIDDMLNEAKKKLNALENQ